MKYKLPLILSASVVGGFFGLLAAQTAPAPAASSVDSGALVPAASTQPAANAAPARAARPAPAPQKVGGIQANLTKTSYKFFFGQGDAPEGYTKITPTTFYSDSVGYGYEPGAEITTLTKKMDGQPDLNIAVADKPYFFSTALPEGNYKVTLTIGHPDVATNVTVKAESRRLMLESVQTKPGEYVTKSFIVNTRRPQYPGGEVKLKGGAPSYREDISEAWDWDNGLTLEINGDKPSISNLQIEKVDVPTVFVIGDSTSCDQSGEPFNSWGQTITRFFKPDVAVANHGESGETIGDNLGRHRFDKIFSLMKPGDYLFVTSGHNEPNGKNGNMNFDQRFYDDFKQVVDQTRAKGGIPVLVSPISRAPGNNPGLGPYPGELKQLADAEKVAYIDLNASSAIFYKSVPDFHVIFATRSEATTLAITAVTRFPNCS